MITAKCLICGREYPEKDMEPRFTGRRRYICFGCARNGNRQLSEKSDSYFNTPSGQKALERRRKER